jgi:hypothetical protein
MRAYFSMFSRDFAMMEFRAKPRVIHETQNVIPRGNLIHLSRIKFHEAFVIETPTRESHWQRLQFRAEKSIL